MSLKDFQQKCLEESEERKTQWMEDWGNKKFEITRLARKKSIKYFTKLFAQLKKKFPYKKERELAEIAGIQTDKWQERRLSAFLLLRTKLQKQYPKKTIREIEELAEEKAFKMPITGGIETQKIFDKEKALISEGLQKKLLDSISIIRENQENTTICSFKEKIEFLTSKNLLEFFQIERELNKSFECILIPNYRAWVSRDVRGHYRYFSRKNDNIYFFDIIDLIEIILELDYSNAIYKLCEAYRVNEEERMWREMQKMKYDQNEKIILKWDKHIKRKYPVLAKYLKTSYPLLLWLNSTGRTELRTLKEKVGEESVFYVSVRHIAKTFQEEGKAGSGKSSIAQKINLLIALGLLRRVKEDDIPIHMFEKAKEISIEKGHGNLISFYTMPWLNEKVLKEAENRAIAMKEKKIASTKFSQKELEEKNVLDKEIIQEVFQNTEKYTKNVVKKKIENQRVDEEVKEIMDRYWPDEN